MRRSAFTLMELLVSVILIALITLFMYGALGSSRASNRTLQTHSDEQEQRMKLYELLYRDCMEAYSVQSVPTKSKHYHVLELQTSNSLYDIAAPHVTYFVNAQTLQLIRLESAAEIQLPVPYEMRERIHADIIIDDVSDFNFYDSKEAQNVTPPPPPSFGNAYSSAPATTVEKAFEEKWRNLATHLIYLNTKQLKEPLLIELAF